MQSETVYTSRAISLDRSTSDLERKGSMTNLPRRLQRNRSDSLNQNRTAEPIFLDMEKARRKIGVPNFEEGSIVSRGGGQRCSGHRSNRKHDKNGTQMERAPGCLLEGRVGSHVEGIGIVSGCCFGRAATTTRKLPSERSVFSGYGSSETGSHGLQCKKSKRSLRNFSCMSSADVLSSVTSTTAASSHLFGSRHKSRACNINHKSKLFGRSKHSLLARGTGCMTHQISHGSEGLLLEAGGPANVDPVHAQSVNSSMKALRAGKWCFVRPSVMKPDTMFSSGNMSQASSITQAMKGKHNTRGRKISGLSLDSCETNPEASFVGDERISQRLVAIHNRDPGFCVRDITEMDAGRRNTTRLWLDSGLSPSTPDCMSANSSVLASSSSFSRSARIPSLYGLWHRTGSLEAMSSPSSYMSSPDVHLSNLDGLCSYASTFNSPDLSKTVSSADLHDEGYHGQSARIPVYRPFCQFPLRSFEENQEYFTFHQGVSEQVFMLEANLLLGGMSLHDQHSDLRLDIDNMSYEDLLALEERIGNVCTGLEKDAISRCLKSKKYDVTNIISHGIEVKCSICQEDFEKGVELGVLQCGHNHHFSCIEQWLEQKNECPICKATAFLRSAI